MMPSEEKIFVSSVVLEGLDLNDDLIPLRSKIHLPHNAGGLGESIKPGFFPPNGIAIGFPRLIYMPMYPSEY